MGCCVRLMCENMCGYVNMPILRIQHHPTTSLAAGLTNLHRTEALAQDEGDVLSGGCPPTEVALHSE